MRPPPRHAITRSAVIAALLATTLSPAARAESPPADPSGQSEAPRPVANPEQVREIRRALRAQWPAAVERGDLPAAEQALARLVRFAPEDELAWLNLMRVQLAQSKVKAAEESLRSAVERGWSDLRRLAADPRLQPLRERELGRQLLANAQAIGRASAELRAQRAAREMGAKAVITLDDQLHIAVVSALEPAATESARREMAAVADWFAKAVLPEGVPVRVAGDKPEELPDVWIVVRLPSRAQFDRWAAAELGARAGSVGGLYDHDRKELVTRDTGGTLRHEFAHVLHWRHCDRLGQIHPMWVQEGLCALVEDVEPSADPSGLLRPVVSWRTNTVRNMAAIGRLPAWDRLLTQDADAFVASSPLANYAVARAIFLFLSEKGVLRAWYTAFTAGHAADPTGRQALQSALGRPVAEIERQWRAWAAALPAAPDAQSLLAAGLPFDVEPDAADGLRITSLPGPAAGGLRLGDVVSRIGNVEIRDLHDLARALADRQPGDKVEVAYRRYKLTGTAEIELAVGR